MTEATARVARLAALGTGAGVAAVAVVIVGTAAVALRARASNMTGLPALQQSWIISH